MNENINLLEILKGIPDGTKLWSPICGECEVESIIHCDKYPIKTIHGKGYKTQYYNFTSQGKLCNNSEAECLLFPSKDNRDWSTFITPWGHKHFEPFEKVLISHFTDDFPDKEIWAPALYGYYDEEIKARILTNGSSRDDDGIIPYESNEDKLGKPVE